jgi:hypothetical protein
VNEISAVIVAMFAGALSTTALSPKAVSGTPPNDQLVPIFQSELVAPVQMLSAPLLSDALKQRTMAVTSGALKRELRSVSDFDFGFMGF